RPVEYYQERKLFPVERLALADAPSKADLLNGSRLSIKSDQGSFALERNADKTNWSMQEPVRDRVDPVKLRSLLTVVPEIWAERFVRGRTAAECGLAEPARTLAVTTPQGKTLTLKIGKESARRKRIVTRMQPIPQQGIMVPVPQEIEEIFHFAQLAGSDTIFEVKQDQLDTLFVKAADLRDPRLARFDSAQATRIEIKRGEETIALVKEDDKWQLDRPYQKPAETERVMELLDALARLEARGDDIIDTKDLAKYGLDPAAGTITVDIEKSEGEGARATKKKETFTFQIGKDDTDTKKLSVRVNGWPRINQVADSLQASFARPALAYRSRKVLDGGPLASIKIQHGDEIFALARAGFGWQLVQPATADIDDAKAAQLTAELSGLEAAEYVAAAPSKEELADKFGLARPELTASVTFKDGKSRTLLLGKKRAGKSEYFAKLEGDEAVFAVKEDLRNLLDQSALALMPLELWQLKPEEIARVELDRQGSAFKLVRGAGGWSIVQPFQAAAMNATMKVLLDDLSKLRCEKYVAVAANDLSKYGLDQPFLKLEVSPPEATPSRRSIMARAGGFLATGSLPLSAVPFVPVSDAHVLLVGKPVTKESSSRFARLAGRDAVFVLTASTIDTLERGALDLLDRNVLSVPAARIASIRRQEGKQNLTLARTGEGWTAETGMQSFQADPLVMTELLDLCTNLHAQRYVAFGAKLDRAKYGLDTPAAVVTLSLQEEGAVTDPGQQAADLFGRGGLGGLAALPFLMPGKSLERRVLFIGKQADKDINERFAMLEGGQGIFVLGQLSVGELMRAPLGYADRSILSFNAEKVARVERKQPGNDLELVRNDDAWQVAKPDEKKADAQGMLQLLRQLSGLRALEVAAYQPANLAPYGLDTPAAELTLTFEDKKQKPIALKIGKETKIDGVAGRFVQAEGARSVGVISQALADRLLAAPLKFRDKAIARFSDADQAKLERGPRKATFAKLDGTWKLTQPTSDKAEQLGLEDLLNALARLRADELVAEKAVDELYGLDRPEARWQFLDGDKVVLDLLVGKPDEKDPARRHARLAGDSVVFLLSPKLTGQLLAEYRNRTPWPSFDAVQAQAIRFDYRENPFLLLKLGERWLAKEQPDAMIDAGKINTLLDALARLKIERFIADKDADPKLYGLDPPELVLEVAVGQKDRRVLHIGRREGDSQRYYARLPDDKSGAVFLLSEEDAKKIVHDLKGLGK
ncbi:MAG: DUF4340 domain-containing protein, partial [Gemmataceae bacterium]